jgi:hypothetical protein
MRLIVLMSKFKSLKTWMSHFQVSRDLDESLSSLHLDEVWKEEEPEAKFQCGLLLLKPA